MLKAALRRKELKRKKAERDKERGKIRCMVEEMNTATRGEVLWDRKNEIRELLEGYEFKWRNAKTLYDLQGKEKEKRTVASVRRELKEYVGENPDAALDPDDLAVLDKRTLDTMTLDELTERYGLEQENPTPKDDFKMVIAFPLKWEGGRNFDIVDGKPILKPYAREDKGGPTAQRSASPFRR